MATNNTLTANEIESIQRFLRVRKWTHQVNPLGEHEYTDPKHEWQVQITNDGYWALGKFTDGDLPNDAYKGGFEAVGRYETECEGDTLGALEDALVSREIIEWECGYCGEAGGDPVTVGWSEFQGDEAHGGRVNFTEERCTKCAR